MYSLMDSNDDQVNQEYSLTIIHKCSYQKIALWKRKIL